MATLPSVVVVATSWGTKFGGLNSFSTDLCRALAQTLTGHRLACVCLNATEVDREDARKVGVTLISINAVAPGSPPPELASNVMETLRQNDISPVEWWIGHDCITGPLATACRTRCANSRVALLMHMSYQDYAFVKHAPEESAEIDRRTEAQRNILAGADVGLAVGPLLFERLKTIRGAAAPSHMIVPGLTDMPSNNVTEDRLHAITFGRFDFSEALIKQAPLVVAAFARSFRSGIESSNPILKSARLRLIGAPAEVIARMRELANKEAGRVVNLEGQGFIEDSKKLRALLHECNVCLMLSWHEGFGLSGWEAIGSGVPLILSTNSGLYQLLDSLGGTVTGCVHAIDVRGSGDGAPNEEDIETVQRAILAVAADIPKARANAKSLRKMLRFECGFTWNRTARETANALGLPVTTTILDFVSSGTPSDKARPGSVQDSVEIATAQRVLTLADSHYQVGQYSEALEVIESLKRYECLRRAPEVALDAVIMEAQIYMRLNRYQPAIALVRKVAQEAHDRSDWLRYVRACAVENTIMRDQGSYTAAVNLARGLLVHAEQECPSEIESVLRLLARSLALKGLSDEAVIHATQALAMAQSRKNGVDEAKAALALGEAYRHGRNDDLAKTAYTRAGDLSGMAGHVDCLLWSLLGLSDCVFLQGDLSAAKEILTRLGGFLESTRHTHPLELLHTRLSQIAIAVVERRASDAEIGALVSDYEALGIRWPAEYFDAIKKPGITVPKRF
jgi:glycosyltransferase involved in cell wall biosynthesis